MVEQGEDAAVLVVAKEFRTSVGTSGRVGAGGVEHFRLCLLKAGRFTVTFVYRWSWEKDERDQLLPESIRSVVKIGIQDFNA
jgi:predicted secreted protein